MDIWKIFGTIAIKDDTKKPLDNAEKNAKKTFGKIGKAAKTLGVAIGAAFAIKAVVNFGKASVEAANAQIEAETKLEEVLKTRTDATDDQIKSIKKLASAQQKLGVIGDEVQLAGAQQLATFVHNTEAVENLLPAMNNLAAQQKGVSATSGDLTNIANLMGKALDGQVGALSRVGISFSEAQAEILKTGTEMERSAILAEVITGNVGNMNEKLAQTDAGKIQQATNNFGDMKEVIGGKILPILAEIANWINKKGLPLLEKLGEKGVEIWEFMQPYIQEIAEKYMPMIDEAIKVTIEFLQVLWELFKKGMEALMPIIEPILKLLVNAFDAAFKLVTSFFKMFTSILKGDWQATADNMRAILTTIKEYFGEQFKIIGDVIGGVWDAVKTKTVDTWSSIWDSVKGFINKIIDGMNSMVRGWNGIEFKIPKKTISMFGKKVTFGGASIGTPDIPEIPKLAVGTDFVPQDMLAMIHEGEQIVPKKYNPNAHGNALSNNENITININNPQIFDDRGVDMMMEKVVNTLSRRGVVPA